MRLRKILNVFISSSHDPTHGTLQVATARKFLSNMPRPRKALGHTTCDSDEWSNSDATEVLFTSHHVGPLGLAGEHFDLIIER
jgi:hypothetical protein